MDSNLAVLNKFVGAWTAQVTMKSADGEQQYMLNTRFQWVLGGLFLQDAGNSPNSENAHIGYWTYDQQSGVYRSWYFLQPPGTVMQIAHTWDEATQTMTGRGEPSGGLSLQTSDQFFGDEEYHWSAVMKTDAGHAVMEIHAECHRVD